MRNIPPACDPSWASAEERTRLFVSLLEEHKLSNADAAKIINRREITIYQWRSDDPYRVIPAPVLRAFMYDLQQGA